MLDLIIRSSNVSQDPRRSQDWQYLTAGKKLTLSFTTHEFVDGHALPTLHPPDVIYINLHNTCSQAFPIFFFFFFLPLFRFWHCAEREPKSKNGGGLGTKLPDSADVGWLHAHIAGIYLLDNASVAVFACMISCNWRCKEITYMHYSKSIISGLLLEWVCMMLRLICCLKHSPNVLLCLRHMFPVWY